MRVLWRRLRFRLRAKRDNVSRPEFAPIGKSGRQSGPDLARTELQKTVTGPTQESVSQDRDQEVARHSPPPTRDARAASGSVPGKRSPCGKRISQKGLLATAWLRLPVPLRKSCPLFTRNLQSGETMVKFSSFGLI